MVVYRTLKTPKISRDTLMHFKQIYSFQMPQQCTIHPPKFSNIRVMHYKHS